jgi:uncharacterized protein (TIGR03000 family)
MYSLVLMMAMSNGAAAAPGWQGGEVDSRGTNFIHAAAHEHYRHGCHGCRGGCYGGCYGGGWSGCCGGGCYGGCYGRGWGGCYGGGGYGGGYAAPYGGAPYVGGAPMGVGAPPGAGAPPAIGAPPARGGEKGGEKKDSEKKDSEKKEKEEVSGPAPATLIVTLPADARLTIDGYTARSSAGTRTFVSPPLERGPDYHYTLKAELRRGDEPVTVSKDVTVRAGQETRVTLDFTNTSVAQK